MGQDLPPAHPSRVVDLVTHRLRDRGPMPLVRCEYCGQAVAPTETSTCSACSRPVCPKCGTILSVHYVHLMGNHLGLSRKYDEEVSRSGSCSWACAEGPVNEALASCLFDALLEGFRRGGVAVGKSPGSAFASSLVQTLPGLPADVTQRLERYRSTDGARRMPFRYVVEGLLAQPRRVEKDGSMRFYTDANDPSQFVEVRGLSFVTDVAEKVTSKAPGSPWSDLWTRSITGVARVLDVSGRFEDAAKVYEVGSLFEKAGAERAKVKGTPGVSLDMAALIREFRDSGMVSVYRCPSCGAASRFSQDTPDTRLKTCQYCGTTFQEDDMASFLSTILEVRRSP